MTEPSVYTGKMCNMCYTCVLNRTFRTFNASLCVANASIVSVAKVDTCIIKWQSMLFLSSNIPSSPAYGVFISQLIRYARACSSYECFNLRAARLSYKLLRQGFVMERLKSSLRNFFGRYWDLVKHYEVSLSQMLHDILGHDHIQWHPHLIRHCTNLRTNYRTGL